MEPITESAATTEKQSKIEVLWRNKDFWASLVGIAILLFPITVAIYSVQERLNVVMVLLSTGLLAIFFWAAGANFWLDAIGLPLSMSGGGFGPWPLLSIFGWGLFFVFLKHIKNMPRRTLFVLGWCIIVIIILCLSGCLATTADSIFR